MKKKGNLIIVILILVIIIVGAIFASKYFKDKKVGEKDTNKKDTTIVEEKEQKKLKIVNEDSKTRPYAVMINNNHSAWPQCGLQDAYIVYEIIVEGGITRMMAVFKDQDTAKIGSVRSARHYFLDYAEENDAIYAHWGGSYVANDQIASRGINDLDGMALEGSTFFRDKTLHRAYEHTGFTNIEKLKEATKKKNYRTETNKDLLLNYSIDELDMKSQEGAKAADDIKLRYSNYQTSSYTYDAENKVYKRSMSNKPHVDLETGKQYTVKNIIIYKVKNYTINGNSGIQELENVGSGEGYFVSGGYAIPITWSKSSHSAQTIYKYTNGKELVVNDGNTFIQICPMNADIDITSNKPLESTQTNTIK